MVTRFVEAYEIDDMRDTFCKADILRHAKSDMISFISLICKLTNHLSSLRFVQRKSQKVKINHHATDLIKFYVIRNFYVIRGYEGYFMLSGYEVLKMQLKIL